MKTNCVCVAEQFVFIPIQVPDATYWLVTWPLSYMYELCKFDKVQQSIKFYNVWTTNVVVQMYETLNAF